MQILPRGMQIASPADGQAKMDRRNTHEIQ